MSAFSVEPTHEAPKRLCREHGCGQEAAPRLTRCYECWLAAQPPVVRADAALRRLALIPEDARKPKVSSTKWPEGRRWCAGCQTMVRLVDCAGSRCKACSSISQHLSRLRSEYGIDPLTYQHLFNLQDGRCAICRGRPTTARLAVDHDHRCCKKPPLCGRCTRGLLCSKCNHELLGAAHDSLQVVLNAVTYLRTPPASGEWALPPLEEARNIKEWGEPHAPPF